MRTSVVRMPGLVSVSIMPDVSRVSCVLALNGAQLRHLARRAAEHGRGDAAAQRQQHGEQQQDTKAEELH